jgi:hypothetical protein
MKNNEQSIIRLLYQKDEFLDLNKQNSNKTILNNSLKHIAEHNEELFPAELRNDKLKKKTELTFEGKNGIKYRKIHL